MSTGASQHKPLIGIGLMVLSCAFLAAKDGVAKSFVDQVGPVQIVWFQYIGNAVVMALVAAPQHGLAVLRPLPTGWQFFRGASSAVAVSMLYWALTYIPLADATAMFMLAPVLVAALSPFLLGERLGGRRIAAIGVGFIGVLVILKPGFGGSTAGYTIGLAAGVFLALYYISNRRLAGLAPPLLNVVHNALTGAIFLSLFLPYFWQPVPGAAVPKLAAIIGLAIFGQALMISSFTYAPAATVAPFTYVMLVFAALIGYAVFGSFPDASTLAGIALIVGAGLFIAHRERVIAARGSRETGAG